MAEIHISKPSHRCFVHKSSVYRYIFVLPSFLFHHFGCFYLETERKTRDEAQQECQMQNENGCNSFLAEPITTEVNFGLPTLTASFSANKR